MPFLQVVYQDKVVEIPKEVIQENIKHVQVPVDMVVERKVPIEKLIERVVEVPRDRVVEIPIERIVEIPVERIVEVQFPVDKRIEVPVDRVVEVPIERQVEEVVLIESEPIFETQQRRVQDPVIIMQEKVRTHASVKTSVNVKVDYDADAGDRRACPSGFPAAAHSGTHSIISPNLRHAPQCAVSRVPVADGAAVPLFRRPVHRAICVPRVSSILPGIFVGRLFCYLFVPACKLRLVIIRRSVSLINLHVASWRASVFKR
jgi:hypothetical protein